MPIRKNKKAIVPAKNGKPVLLHGKTFLGIRDLKKIAAIFDEIEQHKKAAASLLLKTARAYYDAGNILYNAIRRWEYKQGNLSVKNIAETTGFPAQHVMLSLKIFKGFENNPDALKGLSFREALKLIAPPPPAGEDGYNRVDLGGSAGQAEFDFGELFNLPPAVNKSLQNHRTIGDLLSEIIVVRRTEDNRMVSKSFARFFEDVPQNPALRAAFMAMSNKTQAAIEDYLAAVEQEEDL